MFPRIRNRCHRVAQLHLESLLGGDFDDPVALECAYVNRVADLKRLRDARDQRALAFRVENGLRLHLRGIDFRDPERLDAWRPAARWAIAAGSFHPGGEP